MKAARSRRTLNARATLGRLGATSRGPRVLVIGIHKMPRPVHRENRRTDDLSVRVGTSPGGCRLLPLLVWAPASPPGSHLLDGAWRDSHIRRRRIDRPSSHSAD